MCSRGCLASIIKDSTLLLLLHQPSLSFPFCFASSKAKASFEVAVTFESLAFQVHLNEELVTYKNNVEFI